VRHSLTLKGSYSTQYHLPFFGRYLITYLRHWQELGIQGECPYHFTQDELHSHSVDAEGWIEVQDFFNGIEGLVKGDGWTYPDTFDAAFNFFSELRERDLKNMIGEERELLTDRLAGPENRVIPGPTGQHNTSIIGASTTLYIA
jgi:hypothetical protein